MNQIQILVDKGTAGWYYNNYFASFSPEEVLSAEPIYRIYFRRDYSLDRPSEATLPTSSTPVLNHLPGASGSEGMSNTAIASRYPFGFVNHLLFALAKISWSSRYGGSVALDFRQATFSVRHEGESNLEPLATQDDFEYEAVRVSGSDRYLFDLNNVSMRVYVCPVANKFNPKQNIDLRMRTFVEFTVRDTVTYKNGYRVPNEAADPLLQEMLDSAASVVVAGIGGTTAGRPPADQFVLAFIHNQFRDLIGENDKVTKIYISDNWLDLVTESYEPYVFVAFDAGGISTQTNFLEGTPEWDLVVNGYQTMRGGTEHNISTWNDDLRGDDWTGWMDTHGFAIPECAQLDHIRVKLSLSEDDPTIDFTEGNPFSPDNHVGAKSFRFTLNCDAINTQAQRAFYNGWVVDGILPAASGLLRDCDTPSSSDRDEILGVCGDGSILRGSFSFYEGPDQCRTALPSNPGYFTCQSPNYIRGGWKARVGIGAR